MGIFNEFFKIMKNQSLLDLSLVLVRWWWCCWSFIGPLSISGGTVDSSSDLDGYLHIFTSDSNSE